MATKPILCSAVRLRRRALAAAKQRCQSCNEALVTLRTVHDPEEKHTFIARVWNDHPCRNCAELSPILLIFDNEHSQRTFIQWKDLGDAIRKLFPPFYPAYSAKMEMTYYANHCHHCRAFQGDHPTTEWAMFSGRWNTPDEVVAIPGVVEIVEAETSEVADAKPYHVIFEDGDKTNRMSSNLRVLCEACLAQLRQGV